MTTAFMHLRLDVPGASIDRLRSGLAAARAVFAARGVDPAHADLGRWRRQLWALKGFELSDELFDAEDARWAEVWQEAELAAVRAAAQDWVPGQPWPAGAALTLERDGRVEERKAVAAVMSMA